MSGWFDRFRSSAEDPAAALAVLTELNGSQQPLRVAIEGSYHTFATRVRLRSGAVTLTYPANIASAVHEQDWLRLQLPHAEPPQDLRLQVSSARHGGSGVLATDIEHIVLLCHLSGAALVARQRKEERIGTGHYKDVAFQLHGGEGTYRLLDISQHGAKARLPDESAHKFFPVGRKLEHGLLHLGNRVQLPVRYSIPRHLVPDAVGMELLLHEDGRSPAVLDAFITALRRRELAVA